MAHQKPPGRPPVEEINVGGAVPAPKPGQISDLRDRAALALGQVEDRRAGSTLTFGRQQLLAAAAAMDEARRTSVSGDPAGHATLKFSEMGEGPAVLDALAADLILKPDTPLFVKGTIFNFDSEHHHHRLRCFVYDSRIRTWSETVGWEAIHVGPSEDVAGSAYFNIMIEHPGYYCLAITRGFSDAPAWTPFLVKGEGQPIPEAPTTPPAIKNRPKEEDFFPEKKSLSTLVISNPVLMVGGMAFLAVTTLAILRARSEQVIQTPAPAVSAKAEPQPVRVSYPEPDTSKADTAIRCFAGLEQGKIEPIITAKAKQYGVPVPLLKAVLVVQSKCDPDGKHEQKRPNGWTKDIDALAKELAQLQAEKGADLSAILLTYCARHNIPYNATLDEEVGDILVQLVGLQLKASSGASVDTAPPNPEEQKMVAFHQSIKGDLLLEIQVAARQNRLNLRLLEGLIYVQCQRHNRPPHFYSGKMPAIAKTLAKLKPKNGDMTMMIRRYEGGGSANEVARRTMAAARFLEKRFGGTL